MKAWRLKTAWGAATAFAVAPSTPCWTAEAPQEAVDMGAAHGALLQSTRGDTSMITLEEVKHVMKGGSARIKR